MNIYFDIETIPAQSPAVLAQIKADAEEDKQNIKIRQRTKAGNNRGVHRQQD
ncbi:MAG: hypothetical protein IPJ57_20930 [Gemmatimonadetes bacterium]|nr:hypothetical protein [Gemmatimonadota bacterium]